MTGSEGQIRAGDKKSLVGVRRKSAEMLDFQRISVSWWSSGKCIGPVDGQTC